MTTKEEIYNRFPAMFKEKTLHFGDGWNQLVLEFCDYIWSIYVANKEWNKEMYILPVIALGKEKFAGLRLFIDFDNTDF